MDQTVPPFPPYLGSPRGRDRLRLLRSIGHEQELDCRSWPAGPGHRFAQRRPLSPASISAGSGRDASRWTRKGGAEPPGHSAVCCCGRHARHRRRGLRRRDSGPRCWVGPGRLCGGEPERSVQAVHDRGARRSRRARCSHVESEACVLVSAAHAADGPGLAGAWGSLGRI